MATAAAVGVVVVVAVAAVGREESKFHVLDVHNAVAVVVLSGGLRVGSILKDIRAYIILLKT